MRDDPSPAFSGFDSAEDRNFACQQKPQRVDRLADPGGVGYDRDSLPLGQPIKADL
jgi:hypothetical protein